MRSSYSRDDVEILLKDISGKLRPMDIEEREQRIQSGVHYSEMLPLEYVPSGEYMRAYKFALSKMSQNTADAAAALSERILAQKGGNAVLVSLARAGIPAGILVKRYIKNKYGYDIPHYAVSIIRGRGIDKNALNFILKKHNPENIQFLDGWIGKGAIANELKSAVAPYKNLDPELAAISDPSATSAVVGTYEDLLIPSALLNSVVTGLISRTVLNGDVIGENDFHGAAYYSELEKNDLSNEFTDKITACFNYDRVYKPPKKPDSSGSEIIQNIAERLKTDDINFIKPGIGEATRVLLRRKPDIMLINPNYKDSDDLNHLYTLANERGVSCQVSSINLGAYKAVGIIKKLKDI